ncbi:hypothetical protein JHK82_027585 [Glycine max]|nr:hypothetical protein JHK82_027585 [Glycine max]
MREMLDEKLKGYASLIESYLTMVNPLFFLCKTKAIDHTFSKLASFGWFLASFASLASAACNFLKLSNPRKPQRKQQPKQLKKMVKEAFALSSSSNLRLAKPSLCASERRVCRTRASSSLHSSIVTSLCFFSFTTIPRSSIVFVALEHRQKSVPLLLRHLT